MAACQIDPDVLFEDHGNKGLIILNKPKQLNALNYPMSLKILTKLKEWHSTKDMIVINGGITNKAFSAGGDVISFIGDKSGQAGREFFRCAYRTSAMIASVKPIYLAVIHGIAMGGGVALSIHGKYRVASENAQFAMPEAKIGLFPDVGATYYLSRLPNQLGMFLGLTGYRLKGFDLCHVGVGTHFCHSSLLPAFHSEILTVGTDVQETLNKYHLNSISNLPDGKIPEFSLAPHIETINYCYSAKTVEEMIERLRSCGDDFSKNNVKILSGMSPTSLKVTAAHIRRAGTLDVFEVLNTDFRLCSRILEGNDFYEGVRALLVDKDNSPKWNPSRLEDVSDATVEEYFQPLGEAGELNLPRSLEL